MPKKRELEFRAPPLGALLATRTVHLLCSITPENSLRVVYYTTPTRFGREPMWGIWNVNGRFLRFLGKRFQVEEAYPDLVWQKRDATWQVNSVEQFELEHDERIKALKGLLRKNTVPNEPIAAYFEADHSLVPWGEHENWIGDYRPLYAGPVVEAEIAEINDAS